MCMMPLKRYLWTCFGCLVLVWCFIFFLRFFGGMRGPWGWGGFLFGFWRNLCTYWLMGDHPSPRLKPAERAFWWSPWCTASRVTQSLMDQSSFQCPSLAPFAAFIPWGGRVASSCPWLSSPFLPRNCLVDSLLLTHTLSNNSNVRLQSLIHHPRTLHGAENGVWEEWWAGHISAGAVCCGTCPPLPQPAPGIPPQLSLLLAFNFLIFKPCLFLIWLYVYYLLRNTFKDTASF